MTPDQSPAQIGPAPRLTGLSWLAPAALGLLPALLLAFAPGDKDEAYEWTQHRVTGLVFGAVFAMTFLFGRWRESRILTAAAFLVLAGTAAVICRQGLPGFHIIFAVAGVMVAASYHLATRGGTPAIPTTLAVAWCTTLSFWALSRLSWWTPFADVLHTWDNRLCFLGITAGLAGFLYLWHDEADRAGAAWVSRVIHTLVLLTLAAAVARTGPLVEDTGIAMHHWSVFTAPAEMMREGRALLNEAPSQYGFLPMLLLAWLPTDNCFDALFWLHVVTVWISGAIVYFVLRTWLRAWWWSLCAGVITITCVTLLCGDASQQTGPIVYPSVGAVRFIWVHVLLGYLFWWQRRARPDASVSTLLWIGSMIWLLGVVWAVESAAYVTAAWFPAATLLAMPATGADQSIPRRLRAFLTGMTRALGLAASLLIGAMLVITLCYWLFYSRTPEWGAYADYARAFSGGFMALSIEPQGAVWALLLVHVGWLAVLSGLDASRQRVELALTWAAWGAFWSVSTYYVSRSHPNNITNLTPVLLLVIGVFVSVARTGDRHSLARPWVWIIVPPFVGAILWLVATNPAATRRQFADFAVEPRVSKLLPATPPALNVLLAQCQQAQPGAYSVIGPGIMAVVTLESVTRHENWLPLRSLGLFGPLSVEQRAHYLDAYQRVKPVRGWLLAPINRNDAELAWLFEYIKTRYDMWQSLANTEWQAWYYVPKDDPSPRPAEDSLCARLVARLTLWLDHNHLVYWAVAGLATALFAGWVLVAFRADRPAAPAAAAHRWRTALVLLFLLVAWRWPLWFNPANFNPDEGQLVAGAQALVRDPVFWRSVDGATAGPLNFYVLLWPKLVGAPVNFLTARLTGLLLLWSCLVFSYGILRLFLARTPARLALLPVALFFAIVTQDDFVHYSTEHLPLFLFAGSTFLLVRRHCTGAGGNWAWRAGGLGLGLLPWAKLQAIPLGAAVVLWLGFALWRDPDLPAAEKRRRGRDLLLAGLAPSLLFLGLIAAGGIWPQFLQGYVLQNFHYVGTDNTLSYLWATASRSLNSTWHFQVCMGGPLLIAVVGSLLPRSGRSRVRAFWQLGFLLTAAALAAVLAPRRPFAHYLLFLVLPLALWSGAVIGGWWERSGTRRGLVAICLLLGGVLPLALRFSQPVPEMLDRLEESRGHPFTAAGSILRAYARPGDQLGVWGWMCDLHVETGLPQATRQGNSFLCIEPSPQFDYYRRLYLTDLQRSRPALFVDAVGPTADFFEDRANRAHESFPALARYIRENYAELIDLEYARLYVRNDRMEAVRIDDAHLRALADAGRRVRGRFDPEPVSIAQPQLQQNVIAGRVVRMMLPRAEISWPLRGTEREFYYESGYDPRAYIEGDGNGTLFTAELATPSGAVFPIYSRLLDPVHKPSDRGLVRDHFPLPPVPAGSRLVLKTSPGPEENSAWDWAYLAGAAFDHSPLYSYRQFPGFNRVPDAVADDVTYLETENAQTVLALHAPASLTFRLHGGERSVGFDFGFRAGAYSGSGNTDGAGYRVTLRRPGHPEAVLFERLLQPVGQAADRGIQHAELVLPDGIETGAELILAIDPGPSGNPAWDWTYLANLQIK